MSGYWTAYWGKGLYAIIADYATNWAFFGVMSACGAVFAPKKYHLQV